MSLEAITKVTETEEKNKERLQVAKIEAKRMIETAEKDGKNELIKVRQSAQNQAKSLKQVAEQNAKKRAAEILHSVQTESNKLRETAKSHLSEAADLIVGKVVSP